MQPWPDGKANICSRPRRRVVCVCEAVLRGATAGQGLEPRFHGPEPCEFPLFDPAPREVTSIAMRKNSRPGSAGARPRGETRGQVKALLQAGLTNGEVARRLGVSAAAVSFHARKLGIPASRKYAPRDDWDEIQRYYDAGHSVRGCQAKFGFSRRSWGKAVERGDVTPRPQAIPLDELLVAGPPRNRTHIKLRLLAEGLKESRCEDCGITDWLGQPLQMTLHHVNGEGNDNRLENLRLLCANCHSQTPNFARKSRAGTVRIRNSG
jgi:5-methylcytosine-specific restriction endonuclease McrA